nr:MAG TPA: hypothetical protein [Caudoviricetes sp.]
MLFTRFPFNSVYFKTVKFLKFIKICIIKKPCIYWISY